MRGKPLALVTCKLLPEPDPDQEIQLQAFARRGIRAVLLPWDDPAGRTSDYALCVPRSCWNYHENPDAFMAWIEEAGRVSTVVNPPDVMRWNMHKRYLRDLQTAGVPVVPTVWFDRGTPASLDTLRADHGWGSVVVKPSISSGSFRTRRFGPEDTTAGQSFLDDLIRERDVMVQPFMAAFEDPGERALVWIDGELTHAVRKRPRFDGGGERVSESLPVTPEEIDFAREVLSHVRGEPVYGRIDVLPDGRGGLLVSELELIEPSLFFVQNPLALDRFADAIVRRLG